MLYCKSHELCGKRYRSLVVRASGAALIAARMAAAHCSGENRLIAALMSAGTVIFFAARYAVERVVLSQPCFGNGESRVIAAFIARKRIVILRLFRQRAQSSYCVSYRSGESRLVAMRRVVLLRRLWQGPKSPKIAVSMLRFRFCGFVRFCDIAVAQLVSTVDIAATITRCRYCDVDIAISILRFRYCGF